MQSILISEGFTFLSQICAWVSYVIYIKVLFKLLYKICFLFFFQTYLNGLSREHTSTQYVITIVVAYLTMFVTGALAFCLSGGSLKYLPLALRCSKGRHETDWKQYNKWRNKKQNTTLPSLQNKTKTKQNYSVFDWTLLILFISIFYVFHWHHYSVDWLYKYTKVSNVLSVRLIVDQIWCSGWGDCYRLNETATCCELVWCGECEVAKCWPSVNVVNAGFIHIDQVWFGKYKAATCWPEKFWPNACFLYNISTNNTFSFQVLEEYVLFHNSI